jgi:hypothetical protein
MYFSPSLPKLLRSRTIQNLEFPGKTSKLNLLQGVCHSQQEILNKEKVYVVYPHILMSGEERFI